MSTTGCHPQLEFVASRLFSPITTKMKLCNARGDGEQFAESSALTVRVAVHYTFHCRDGGAGYRDIERIGVQETLTGR
jgi:hypothetical protein